MASTALRARHRPAHGPYPFGHQIVDRPGVDADELLALIADAEGLVIRSGTKVTADVIAAGDRAVAQWTNSGVTRDGADYANRGATVISMIAQKRGDLETDGADQ